jgi:ELWxxDGT repeat protein
MSSGISFLFRAACCALLSAALPAFALDPAEPVLVADFDPGAAFAKIEPAGFTSIGDLLYFSGYDPQHGREPWVTDGTAAGTRRLADLCPGPCSGEPTGFFGLGDKILIGARGVSAVFVFENGQVEEIAEALDWPGNFFRFGEVVIFTNSDPGRELVYRTDGTRAGTYISADFCRSVPCFAPTPIDQPGGGLYYSEDGNLYRQVAEGQRVLVAPNIDYTHNFTALDANRAIFHHCSIALDVCAAWVTDGTAAGTRPLEPAPGGSLTDNPQRLVLWRGRVYFANRDYQWVSTDGTPEGTRLEPALPAIYSDVVAATGDQLFYQYFDPAGSQRQLRALDPFGNSVVLLATEGEFGFAGRLGDRIFVLYRGPVGSLLASTDGTPAGTAVLGETWSFSPGTAYGGFYYFRFAPLGEVAAGLWRSAGSGASTNELAVDQPDPDSGLLKAHRLGSALIAGSRDRESGQFSTWRIDPQSLAVTATDPPQIYLGAVGGSLAFGLDYGQADLPLVAVTETTSTVLPANRAQGAIADDDHYFFGTGRPGQKLWESDGTAAGTRLLFDFRPDYVCLQLVCGTSYPAAITPSGDNVFFVAAGDATAESYDDALWVYRRSAGQAHRLRPLEAGLPVVAAPGGRIAFVDFDRVTARQTFWVSDGSDAGTYPFLEVPRTFSAGKAVVAGQRLFFVLSSFGREWLWVSDLSPGGTAPLTPEPMLAISDLVAAGDHVFFSGRPGNEEEVGHELGFSDGTKAGTFWVDLRPGPGGSRPHDLLVIGGQRVVFAAAGDAAGDELWISDGTLAGSSRLTDLAPGEEASAPSDFAEVGGRLFFQANDGLKGRELWAIDLPAARPACPADRLCLLGGRFEVQAEIQAPNGVFAGRRALATAESGIFTFFSPDNWELLVKVLDGCPLNQNFWVYASAASDLPYRLTIKDRASGAERTFDGQGPVTGPILDSGAFYTCALPPPEAAYSPAAAPAAAASRCPDDPQTLCFGPGGRYRVSLGWQTATAEGCALPVPSGSADSGLFTFFSPSNWEVMVKLLDGCALNGQRWVFAAGTTDVGWTLTVTDRQTGNFETYQNQSGQPSRTVADIAAFDCN